MQIGKQETRWPFLRNPCSPVANCIFPSRMAFPMRDIRVICGSLMIPEFENQVSQTLEEIKSQGLFKTERIITTPQDAHIAITGGKRVLNMCANNYLGLADNPALIAAAKEALDTHGF